MSQSRLSSWGRYVVFLCVTTLIVLLMMEAALRVFAGKPEGYFYHHPSDGSGLYLPNRTLRMIMGPFPYTIETNSLGFRGREITKEKPEGEFRIVAIGDSVTDGFYVDNEDTYPVRLMEALAEGGRRVEVVNAARGGATIDKEYYILRRFGVPLSPDLVVLTFVTNDLDDMRGHTREELVNMEAIDFEPSAKSEALFFARTALGEMLLDWSMKLRFDKYRGHERIGRGAERTDRYNVAGGEDFAVNVQDFIRKHVKPQDGILAYERLTAEHFLQIETYLYVLGHMKAYLDDLGIALAFVYVPGYNQVHDLQSTTELPERLRAGCEALGVPFLNLTEAFRSEVKKHAVHLAPIDHHLKPVGNKMMGREVGAFLKERFFDVHDGVAENR